MKQGLIDSFRSQYGNKILSDIEKLNKYNAYNEVKDKVINAENYSLGGRVYNDEKDKRNQDVETPKNTVKSMIDLIPADKFTSKAKFLNIYSKNGEFIIQLIDKFMNTSDKTLPINNEPEYTSKITRLNNLIQNQLFALCGDLNSWHLSNKRVIDKIESIYKEVYGDSYKEFRYCNTTLPNINFIKGYKDLIKKDSVNFLKDRVNNMTFDVVIGNPPYNPGDVYLDFVTKSFDMITKYNSNKQDNEIDRHGYIVMITPAKWQAKSGERYDLFRKNIVPYMSKIVHFQEEGDVFNDGKNSTIRETGGICYYLIDTAKRYEYKEIENKSYRVKAFNIADNNVKFDSTVYPYPTVNLWGQKIANKVGVHKEFNMNNYVDNNKRYQVALNTQVIYWGSSEVKWFFSPDGMSAVLSNPKLIDTYSGETLTVGAAKYVFSTDNIQERDSFVSYINTRFSTKS